jgi:hypothetical protein
MNRLLQTSAIAAGTLLASTASAELVTIANSIADFSNTQGLNGWSYGWYTGDTIGLDDGAGTLDTSEFQAFGHYDSAINWWTHDAASAASGSGATPFFLTVITAELIHANTAIPGTGVANESRWASRRWTSDMSGQVQVTGEISKVDQGTPAGDGVDAYVLIDGEIAFYYALSPTDYQGTSFDLLLDVSEGSLIELVVGGNENGLNDAARFTANIAGDVVPAPGAVALLGMGGVLIGRRRR